jgi:nucleoside-diphosphate-sugar epimerase
MLNIIGGSGFIGTNLVRLLKSENNLDIKIIDKAPSESFPSLVTLCDVRSIDNLRLAISQNSLIVNLAAEHRDDVFPESLYKEVNVYGAKNICMIANEKNVKVIIFTSSVAVYGFAPIGTDESGIVAPFNEYGRTKYEAELIYKAWQVEAANERTLVIIRPTVVFGEQNRGNVYNLLRQISNRYFIMVGNGENRKSLAYVQNVAAFIKYCLNFKPGVYTYNYADKPDFSMNILVLKIKSILGNPSKIGLRIPFAVGFLIGIFFDFLSFLTGKKFAISSIRVKKFCANSVYDTAISQTGFIPPFSIEKALSQTIHFEFIESHQNKTKFYSE